MRILLIRIVVEARSVLDNAAVEQCPKGICLELLVLPAAERRGNQEFAAQLPHSPRSEAEGGTIIISRPRHRRRHKKENRLFGVGWMKLFCVLLLLAFYQHVSLNSGAAVKTILVSDNGSALIITSG
jgi:hypothetical protein